jgi:hypothetical protein
MDTSRKSPHGRLKRLYMQKDTSVKPGGFNCKVFERLRKTPLAV